MKIRLVRFALLGIFVFLVAGGRALALDDPNRITLPTAASIVGEAPFFSDVRVFNTSYDSTISIEATYRCYIGDCPSVDRGLQIVVPPRDTESFNDIVGVVFSAPGSAGAIEFLVTGGGSAADVGVTSRLYSTFPQPTVGMFVPGVPASAAQPITFLGQIANGGPGRGFRTNTGAFNPGDAAVSARFDVFDHAGRILGSVTRSVGAHKGVQINDVFGAIGRESDSFSDAVIVVTATAEVFSYAAVIDNGTTDPFLVIGAEDKPAPPAYVPSPAPTSTPTVPQPTQTPSPTPTPSARTAIVNVGQGGMRFVDQISGNNVTNIHVGDTVQWVWQGTMGHGVAAGTCTAGGGYGGTTCTPTGAWDSNVHTGPFTYSYTFTQPGSFPYFCDVHLGLMTGVVQVN
jgi:plastocyanin